MRVWAFAAALAAAPAAAAEWQAIEKVATYPIAGSTGAGLYASIGERGPEIGSEKVRTIAVTNFKLTWTRDYQPRDGACTLVSAKPKLLITYTLPKPSDGLSAPVRRSWDRFAAGMQTHERVHGDFIRNMVKEIEAFTVGLSVPDDAGCRKIRALMKRRLAEFSQAQRRKSREFDRTEHADGGNIHRLILELVNGP